MSLNLKQKQLDAVVKILNLNHPVANGATADEEVYKVLVLDRFCRDILSPLIRVDALRKHGITLYLMIDVERQNIPDVPAIYFVQPTSENIQRILRDAARGMYDSFHLNFSSSLPRPLLEELAAGAVKAECLHRFVKVFDQYLSFVSLEPNLFSLGQPKAYLELNHPAAQDSDIEAKIEEIVDGLFSVLTTLGVVPIIRCAANKGAAEMVGRLLDTRLRNHLVSRVNLFNEGGHLSGSFQRPLLCIFDRNFELAVAVQHVFTYRPLVHDILGLHLNRVSVQTDAAAVMKGGKGAIKSYELDEGDPFWLANAQSPFPKLAEEAEAQLSKYKQDIEEVHRKTGGKGNVEGFVEDDELAGNTKNLMHAVNSLPQLTERKRTIDKHMNIATALLGAIKSRTIDGYFDAEEDMLTRGSADRAALLSVLSGKGTEQDKLRFAVVYLLATEATPPADLEAIENVLQESGANLAPLQYVKKLKSLNVSLATASVGSRGNLLDWADKLYGQGINAVREGVKNIFAGGRQLALTRAVEALMENKTGLETDGYLYLDPRAPPGSTAAPDAAGRGRGPFKEAVVFIVGGGNYLEYGSLEEFAQRQQPPKNIIYGSTDLLTGNQFLEQLTELGK